MKTLTLAQQMQVVFDKLSEPAVVDAEFVVIEESATMPTVRFVEYPIKPDDMTDEDWNDFQAWVMDSFEVYPLTEAGLEMAGALAPRCDY